MKTWMTITVLYNSAAASKRPTLLTVITRLFLRQWCGLWAHTKALDKEKAIVVIYDSAAVAEVAATVGCCCCHNIQRVGWCFVIFPTRNTGKG